MHFFFFPLVPLSTIVCDCDPLRGGIAHGIAPLDRETFGSLAGTGKNREGERREEVPTWT